MRARSRSKSTDSAKSSLRHFRQATILAVAITAFIFLLFSSSDDASAVQQPQDAQAGDSAAVAGVPDTVSIIEDVPVEELQAVEDSVPGTAVRADTLLRAARSEAERTARGLWYAFLVNLPKVAVAVLALLLAWIATRLIRPLLRRAFRQWERANATIALIGIGIWLCAVGVAVSVLAGDIRALVGSLGLVGLALSWALQTPIESFTGWLLNSFQGYFRVGDRVSVGDVFGDVYRIDFLTTTVWEIGSLERPGFVHAEQATGRLITFPNSAVLAGSIVNLTRDFPFVWDELTVAVGDKTDIPYATELLRRVMSDALGGYMEGPARQYEAILLRSGLETSVSATPEVFVSLGESWIDLSARYLVGARERRRWKSTLAAAAVTEFAKPEHGSRIVSVFPRHQLQLLDSDGRPTDLDSGRVPSPESLRPT